MPLPVSPEVAFTICTRPDLRMEWLGVDQVALFDTNTGKIMSGMIAEKVRGIINPDKENRIRRLTEIARKMSAEEAADAA